jgi:hypothetical protein
VCVLPLSHPRPAVVTPELTPAALAAAGEQRAAMRAEAERRKKEEADEVARAREEEYVVRPAS